VILCAKKVYTWGMMLQGSSINTCLSVLDEIFWDEFLVNLHEWMERLANKHLCWLPWLRIEWTTKNLIKIEQK